jgi:hypothetical protein
MTQAADSIGMQIQAADAIGQEIGARKALEHYEKYRKVAIIPMVLFFLYSLYIGAWAFSILTFGAIHFHIYLNQIWWKMVNFEHYHLEKNEPKD